MGSPAITAVIDLGPISRRLGLDAAGVEAVVGLLDAGNTVPFITRYRRDQTGGLDEVDIRRIAEAVGRARQLADRKQTVLRTIQGQGRLTPELETRIQAADNPKQLEDLYLPFKPRKLSLAEIARQRRLEPLAREILMADPATADLDRRAADFIDETAEVATVADVLLGVGHIIAEDFSARPQLRQQLRDVLQRSAKLTSQRVEIEGKPLSKDERHFRDYFAFSEAIDRVPPHRVLAINRGERARLLKVRIEGPVEELQAVADALLVPSDHPHGEFLRGCARDALSRLVMPSLEREIRREMTDFCESHAVEVFARNLRNLLLQPPVAGCRVLALDPGFKSGCKAAAIDEGGTPLEHVVLHIVGQKEKREAAAKKIVELVTTHRCSVIAIGNGAAGRETESLVAELVAGELAPLDVGYVIVNEAGASVYSTSAFGREELPAHQAAIRGAISIGRRLQDPLSELVKIEPANIGVGLYQHDVKARHLHASLDTVVESCVNFVGVNVNTASPALLRYVSGLTQATARNLHEWRTTNGAFVSRQQFLEVAGFGEATYVQAVGFLKIVGGSNPLDSTWIHPESYPIAEQVLSRLGAGPEALADRESVAGLAERAGSIDLGRLAAELGVGRLLLADILEQLLRPGRDPREDLPQPIFKKGVLKFDDLEVGMELLGSVLNVVDFGAFVDIGLHDSGLVHISQLSSRYVRDPHEVVSVGQVVQVWVLELDKARRRVALTMISPERREQRAQRDRGPRRDHGGQRGQGGQRDQGQRDQGQRDQGQRDQGQRVPVEQRTARPSRPPRSRETAGASPPRAAGPARESAGDARPASGAVAEGLHRPPRGRRHDRPRREQGPRSYVSRPREPAPPISDAMKQGREPLRTFGDLKQFLESREPLDTGNDAPPPGVATAADQGTPVGEKPPPAETPADGPPAPEPADDAAPSG